MAQSFAIKGDFCYSKNENELKFYENSFSVCIAGKSAGVFRELPEKYRNLPLIDYTGKLITPGLVDLHVHAPQYAFRGLCMDMELLDWLNAYAFPEEAKHADIEYSRKSYSAFADDLKKGAATRACIFATIHVPATLLLMELLENTGIVSMVGKVNMDRNSPDILREKSSESSAKSTREWLERCKSFKNTSPVLTPRFIPSCTDDLLQSLSKIQKEYRLPVQSHLSENKNEIDFVQKLYPKSSCYGEVYKQFDLFGGETPAVMAHCVWSDDKETELLSKQKVFIAHCPQSNMNLSSGAAPVRRYLSAGIPVGLGSDVAGGAHTSIFRAMTDAIQVSKLRRVLTNENLAPLTLEEAFYMGTLGGGAFFGKVGSFEEGYEFDALVTDDKPLAPPFELTLRERLERVVYLADDRYITAKYVRGISVF